MCLGGGVEISLHAAARQPHAELYMGLVEAGVGLIPGGGGCKEMLLRSIEAGSSIRPDARGEERRNLRSPQEKLRDHRQGHRLHLRRRSPQPRLPPPLRQHHHEPRPPHHRRKASRPRPRRQRLLRAASRAPTSPPPANPSSPPSSSPSGPCAKASTSPTTTPRSPTGSPTSSAEARSTPGTLVSEQYLLDLEREAFLSLCGEKKTQERIAFTLKTGKPLRN